MWNWFKVQIKKVLGVLLLPVALVMISVPIIGYYSYPAARLDIDRMSRPVKHSVHFSTASVGSIYKPNLSLSSPAQLAAFRKLPQPLYLRAVVTVPSAAIYQPVYEGTSERVLSYGAGTIRPNEDPQQNAAYAIADHNMYDYPYDLHFSGLQMVNVVNMPAYVYDGIHKRLNIYQLGGSLTVDAQNSMQYTIASAFAGFHLDTNGNVVSKPQGSTVPRLVLYTCVIDPARGWLTSSGQRIISFGVLKTSIPEQQMTARQKSLFPSVFAQNAQIAPQILTVPSRPVVVSTSHLVSHVITSGPKTARPSFLRQAYRLFPANQLPWVIIESVFGLVLFYAALALLAPHRH